MKRLLFTTTALTSLVAASSAGAADLLVKAPAAVTVPNWTGFYVGLNAGGAVGSADPNTSISCTTAAGFQFPYLGFTGLALPCSNALFGSGSASQGAFVGGGQLGYNLQSSNVVYGIEGDFDSLNLKPTRQATGSLGVVTGASYATTSSASTNWLFTARGRVGWAAGPALVYATGGLAVTDLGSNNSYTDTLTAFFPGPGVGTWNASTTKLGWTVGGGLEWALNHNWSVKVEYLYVKFGSVTASGLIVGSTGLPPPGPGYGNAVNTSVDLSASIARAGVNYKF